MYPVKMGVGSRPHAQASQTAYDYEYSYCNALLIHCLL